MTDTYKESNTYTTPVYEEYEDYSEGYEDDVYDDYPYEDDERYHEDDEIEEVINYRPADRGRVLRLMLMILLVLLLVSVIIFGVIPYVEAMSQSNVLPLPPAVQT